VLSPFAHSGLGYGGMVRNADLSFWASWITIGKEEALRWWSIQGSGQVNSERAQTS
jgi:hypothetical protein